MTRDRYEYAVPAWSPEGSRIAFVDNAVPSPYGGLYSAGSDGKDVRLHCALPFAMRKEFAFWSDTRIDWSPDLKNLVYPARTFSHSGPADLVAVNLDTCAYTLITDLHDRANDPWAINYMLPTWSHERTWDAGRQAYRTRIATTVTFCKTTPEPTPNAIECPTDNGAVAWNSDVVVIDVWLDDQGQVVDRALPAQYVNLTSTTTQHEYYPDFDAGGTAVIFSRYDDDPSGSITDAYPLGLWRASVDGSGLYQITPDERRKARWSPDGEYVSSLPRDASEPNYPYYRYCAVDGSEGTFLTSHNDRRIQGAAEWNPLWQDDLPAATCPDP